MDPPTPTRTSGWPGTDRRQNRVIDALIKRRRTPPVAGTGKVGRTTPLTSSCGPSVPFMISIALSTSAEATRPCTVQVSDSTTTWSAAGSTPASTSAASAGSSTMSGP